MFFIKKKSAVPVMESPPSIFCDAASPNARRAFEMAGFRFAANPDKAELLWLRKRYRWWFAHLRPDQFLNHLPGESAITDKCRLTENLKNHDRARPASDITLSKFYPESYLLDEETERAAFFARLPAKDVPENLWILKPGDSSSGRGIQILWQFDGLRDCFAQAKQDQPAPEDIHYIAQRYIRNPLLLEGRKSEIRIYWLIASMEPLRVLLYEEGTVRLNSQPFRLGDFENTLIHVTNVHQQKIHPNYNPNLTLKWTFADWEHYLVNELGVARPGFVRNELMPRLKQYLRFVVQAARHLLSEMPAQGGFFGLYGADLILDDQLQPWLTEIQKGPGIDFDAPVKKTLIPEMLEESIRIMLELRRTRRRGLSPKDFDVRKRFEGVVQPE